MKLDREQHGIEMGDSMYICVFEEWGSKVEDERVEGEVQRVRKVYVGRDIR